MPAPGDQHRDTPASVNPFRDDGPRISEYTAKEIATLQSRLEKQLGPEYISTRPGAGGGKVHYLAAEKVINLANEVFGFNGWSSSIQNVQIDFVDESPQSGRVNLGLSTIVRVTLKDGTYHEDIGYGHCENTKGKAAAFEKAKKEAATDAMKRALRNFGNVLGNCLYDKDYLTKITKVKVAPSKWDPENLHRHPDFAPVKREPVMQDTPRQNNGAVVQGNTSVPSNASFGSAELEDDFGGNIFDESDFSHPDEIRLDETVNNGPQAPVLYKANVPQQNGQRQGVSRTNSMPQMRPPNVQSPVPIQGVQPPQKPQSVLRPPINAGQAQTNKMLPPQTPGHAQRPPQAFNSGPQQPHNGVRSNSSSNNSTDTLTNHPPKQANGAYAQSDPTAQQQPPRHDGVDEQGYPIPRDPPQGVPGGFVTGRKADVFNNPSEPHPDSNIAFNPHADSPSIRRTQGINPGKSAPVRRTEIAGGAGNPQSPALQPPTAGGFQGGGQNGFNAPQRPIGANFINPSADANRKIGMPGAPGGFQPSRNGYRPPTSVKRPAMTDVTNTHVMDGASDPKKAKLDAAAPVQVDNSSTTDHSGVTT